MGKRPTHTWRIFGRVAGSDLHPHSFPGSGRRAEHHICTERQQINRKEYLSKSRPMSIQRANQVSPRSPYQSNQSGTNLEALSLQKIQLSVTRDFLQSSLQTAPALALEDQTMRVLHTVYKYLRSRESTPWDELSLACFGFRRKKSVSALRHVKSTGHSRDCLHGEYVCMCLQPLTLTLMAAMRCLWEGHTCPLWQQH